MSIHWPRLYLAVQSLAIIAWWLMLAFLPTTREWFAPATVGGLRWLLWFLPADVITTLGGLLAACWWRAYAGRFGLVVCLIGISTQTLASIAVALGVTNGHSPSPWFGAMLMTLASIGTLACVGQMLAESRAAHSLFRAAPSHLTRRELVRRTLLQSAVLWPSFLVVLPWALARIEHAAGWPTGFGAMTSRVAVGGVLFVLAGLVNLATARAMIYRGGGTPLPVCMANRLVTNGPYAFVRNPMCMSALAQGLGVSILIASPLTAVYVALGGIVWHVLIRPAEERDLGSRFGAEYIAYRNAVRCWWPRLRTSAKPV